ncbi:hypothetical protein [Streptomyces spongiae]|uniref:DUF1795 domain-containing protein n=1 Tax=Streptomyces spongiae TaxID=565072 RepID=A0A5N8XL79_9ACTN|nr:hypothetical protein [Streptomyces spongiae]MPY60221.1 hypothetical protein [Streptomyces spongiae]
MSTVQTPKMAVGGYTILMPPGWDRIPLNSKSETQDAIKGIVDHAVKYLDPATPKEKVTEARLELHGRLNRAVADARRRNGVDVYLPVEPIHGFIAPASFLVSKVSPGLAAQASPSEIMSHLTEGFGPSEDITLDEVPGVRCQRSVPANPKEKDSVPSRQVNYVVPVPDSGDVSEWLIVSFTTLTPDGTPQEFLEILTELFDAVMTTFRWSAA